MKRAANRNQCFHVFGCLLPLRQVALDTRDLFLGLFDEQFQQFRIEVLRIRRDDRHRYDCSSLRTVRGRLLFGSEFIHVQLGDFHRFRDRYLQVFLFLEALLEIAQYDQTGFRVVQHVPRLPPASLDCLHVVLDADDGICQSIRFFLREPAGTTTLERQGNQSADPVDDFHGAGLVQHQEPGLDAAN